MLYWVIGKEGLADRQSSGLALDNTIDNIWKASLITLHFAPDSQGQPLRITIGRFSVGYLSFHAINDHRRQGPVFFG
jgi:hypothetical protein